MTHSGNKEASHKVLLLQIAHLLPFSGLEITVQQYENTTAGAAALENDYLLYIKWKDLLY